MGQFALQVAEWAKRTKSNADKAVAAAAVSILNKIVLRSPVGNPELWAVNREAAYGRATHNLFVDQINADLYADPSNLTKSGNLKRSVRKERKLGKRRLKEVYEFRGEAGYVGGRFRGNWQLSYRGFPTRQLDRIDPTGAETMADGAAKLAGFTAGPPIFIVNNLPYGPRLEYEAWSSQAPAGMVRITVAEFQQIMAEEVAALK